MHGSPRFLLNPAPGDTLTYALAARRFTEPRIIRAVTRFEEFLREKTEMRVGGVLGPPDYLATTEFLVRRRAPGSRRVPNDQDRIAWLFAQYGRVRGPDRLRELVTPDRSRGLVTVFLQDANFRDTARLLAEVRAYAAEHLAPAGIEVACAGDVAVSQALVGGIVSTQVRSLVASLLGIFAVTALLLRSLRWGVACVLPAAAAVAFTFAFMGFTGVTLGVATAMFAAMTLGIGVDFSIHLIAGYRRAAARGLGRDRAIVESVAATGPAILVDGLAVGLGFGILVLSQVPANARLGAMTAVCLLGCITATLLLIPALLRLTPDRGAREP
jgi:predicted RND superfamily exporter protein